MVPRALRSPYARRVILTRADELSRGGCHQILLQRTWASRIVSSPTVVFVLGIKGLPG
jgi:hypothetical protein